MGCAPTLRSAVVACAVLGVALAASPAVAERDRARPLVVVDPGHGGTNVGARGVLGLAYEKQVTLALARKLERELEARGAQVALTRDDDRYVSLRRRAALASDLDADAFVSLHANASGAGDRRGYETFILSPEAVEVDAPATRGLGQGRRSEGAHDVVGALVSDVERGAAVPRAAALAGAIQDELRELRGAEGDRGVRQAPFGVLMGAPMPAVLVEVGFLDHPIEGLELLRRDTQRALAAAIAEAVAGPRGVDSAPPPRRTIAGHTDPG